MSNSTNALTAAGLDQFSTVIADPADALRGFKLKKRVTVALLKMEEGAPYVVRFDGPITLAKPESNRKARAAADGTKPMDPPKLALVTWYSPTGEQLPRQIIVPAVLQAELEEQYPDASYVGRVFAISKHAIQGKRYKGFEIAELEPDGTAQEPAEQTVVGKGRGKR